MPSSVAREPSERKPPFSPEGTPARLWLPLLVSAVLMLFSYGRNNISLAAWLAPVFLLRFVRQTRLRVWLPVSYLVTSAAVAFQFRGMVPIEGAPYYVFLAVASATSVVPFLLDRWLVPKLGGLTASLVFPCAWTAVDYLNSLGPFGSWGAAGYSQYGNLPLLQVVSVTGLWGLTFLMGWVAAVSNLVWERGLASRQTFRVASLCFATIAGLMLAGGARLTLFPPSSRTVRIASLSKRKVAEEPSDGVWNRALANQATPSDTEVIRKWAALLDQDLLKRAEQEAQLGARIVFWGEANALAFAEDEPAFLAQGRQLAAKYQAYLGMAVGVWHLGKNPPFENKLVLIQPDGEIAWQYNKIHPVPGPEAETQIRGDGQLRVLASRYGRLSSLICFDADFPRLVAQAGALGTDIVLDPSNDWRAIDPWHTEMASFRSIEEGVNLVRQTSQGLSAAFDYQGRRLSAMDHYQTEDYDMISEVPTRGVRTIYSRVGDWFAWLSILTLVGLASGRFREKRV